MTIFKIASYKGEIDVVFIIGLLLFVQGNSVLKLVGLFFICLLKARGLSRELCRIDLTKAFYILLISQSLLMGFIFSGIKTPHYGLIAIVGALLWLVGLLFYGQVRLFVKNDPLTIRNSLKVIFYINALFSFGKILQTILQYGISIVAGNSFGDLVMGIYANSSVNMIINSFFLVYFFKNKNYKEAVLSAMIILSTTYMSGIILFIGVMGFVLFFSNQFKVKSKIILVALGIFLFIAFSLISPSNVRYAKDNLSNVFLSDSPPRKIESFIQTYTHYKKEWTSVFFGEGAGNFSSRLAFTVAGEYVGWYPAEWEYRNPDFVSNHFSLWNKEVLSKPYNDGTANQPFSVYNQIMGEYGLFGVCCLGLLYIGKHLRRYSKLTYGKTILIAILGYFLLDYWYEYFSVMIFFELFMELDYVTGNSSQYNNTDFNMLEENNS